MGILLISEAKLNDTYPGNQFYIDGFHPPYRKDRNDKVGGLVLFIKDFIPSRILNIQFNPVIECMVIEINLKKEEMANYLFIQSSKIYYWRSYKKYQHAV